VRKATRGRESALQRKQELVKSQGDKIIRNWVQELVHFCPGREKGYDSLEVKSLKRITRYDHKNRFAWFLAKYEVPPWDYEASATSARVPVCILALVHLRSQNEGGNGTSSLIVSECDGPHLEFVDNITRRELPDFMVPV